MSLPRLLRHPHDGATAECIELTDFLIVLLLFFFCNFFLDINIPVLFYS